MSSDTIPSWDVRKWGLDRDGDGPNGTCRVCGAEPHMWCDQVSHGRDPREFRWEPCSITLTRDLLDEISEGHPFPWRIDHDWMYEVLDANGGLVMKIQLDSTARELVRLAAQRERERRAWDVEIAALNIGGDDP